MRKSNAHAALVGILAAALVLLCFVWFWLQRTPALELNPPPPHAPTPDESSALGVVPGSKGSELGIARVLVETEPPPQPKDETPAIITCFLTIDDVPQDGGVVRLRSEDGTWERTAYINYNGWFRLDGVPITKLTASFELPPQNERHICLPRLEILPRAGKVEDLSLHWASTQINVKVTGDGPEGNRARVGIEGPELQASIETSENGRGLLSVVGGGHFTFTATQPSGRRGLATIDLEGDEGLETVVITMQAPD